MTHKPLLFQKAMIQRILEGTKTQTRRRIGENGNLKVGDVLALKRPWSRQTYGLIEITAVRHQPISEISQEELEAEGFQTLTEFKRAWGHIYGQTNGREVVKVYEFRMVAPERGGSPV